MHPLTILYFGKLIAEWDPKLSLWENMKNSATSVMPGKRVTRSTNESVVEELIQLIENHEEEEEDSDEQGLMNKLIDWLPGRVHLPGYEYCGPGTESAPEHFKIIKTKNQLDQACLEHDLVYINHKKESERADADAELYKRAMLRMQDENADHDERTFATVVAVGMLIKGGFYNPIEL